MPDLGTYSENGPRLLSRRTLLLRLGQNGTCGTDVDTNASFSSEVQPVFRCGNRNFAQTPDLFVSAKEAARFSIAAPVVCRHDARWVLRASWGRWEKLLIICQWFPCSHPNLGSVGRRATPDVNEYVVSPSRLGFASRLRENFGGHLGLTVFDDASLAQ